MARIGRPPVEIQVTPEERQALEAILRRKTTSQQLAKRVRIVLGCADGLSNTAIGQQVGMSKQGVGKWRARFAELGMAGLEDALRSGGPRTIDDEKIEELVKMTLESKPKGTSRWSTRDMAKKAGIGRDSVSRIWRAFGLKPHRSDTFQLSTDPEFVDKVRDVVGLYMDPPTNALVLSVDEKSQIQALNRTQPLLPLRPTQSERVTPEYQRNGTTTLFAALNVATGHVIGKCYKRHRTIEFLDFLKLVDRSTATGLDLHLVLDNYGTHKAVAVKTWLLRHPRVHLHFTPTHASWLNQVETLFSVLTEKQLKRGSHYSARELEAAIHEFLDAQNEAPKPFRWVKTADVILANLARTCETTLKLHEREDMK